jgi:hypothetical protein
MEGAHCYLEEDCATFGMLPVAEYEHGEDSCSITGIGVYRGTEFTSLDGIYFNADYCSGKFWGLVRDEDDTWTYAELLDTELLVAGAGSDEAGELYVTTCTCDFDRSYDPEEELGGGGGGEVVQVSLVDGAIEMPDQLPAGPVTFEVINDGTIDHNFEVEGEGIAEVFPENLAPGESQTMEFEIPSGEYRVYCPVADHAQQGMELSLTVE